LFTQLFFLFLLILINAFFAASEIALISLNDNKLKLMAEEGDKKARLIQKLLSDPSGFLATIQIGITLTGFLASAFAAQTFADRLAALMQRTGIPVSQGILKGISVALITLILSYFSLVIGELVPKRLAMQKSEKISRLAARPLLFIARVARPFVIFLTLSTNFFVKILGGNPDAEEEEVTEEEIRMMIDVGEEKGTIQEIEKEMINNIFDFDNKLVADIMTHRTEIAAVPIDASLEEIIDLVYEEKFTRIPVYEETIDNIIGILHVKDLLKFIKRGDAHQPEPFKLEELLRTPYFVPESKKIDELFQELQMNQTHMAVVIDEYGGTAGIVTIEDLVEEIVGNILDEYDEEEKEYEKLDENTYLMSGSIDLEEVEKLMNIKLPSDEYDTLGGFIIGQLGRIPDPEETPTVELDDVTFKVEEIVEKRIVKVKTCRV
jgi:putative hemolysin